jgi:hypothetical protein
MSKLKVLSCLEDHMTLLKFSLHICNACNRSPHVKFEPNCSQICLQLGHGESRVSRLSREAPTPRAGVDVLTTTVAVDNNQKNWLRETEKSRGKRRLVGERLR